MRSRVTNQTKRCVRIEVIAIKNACTRVTEWPYGNIISDHNEAHPSRALRPS